MSVSESSTIWLIAFMSPAYILGLVVWFLFDYKTSDFPRLNTNSQTENWQERFNYSDHISILSVQF